MESLQNGGVSTELGSLVDYHVARNRNHGIHSDEITNANIVPNSRIAVDVHMPT